MMKPFYYLLLVISLIISSCKKEEDDDVSGGAQSSGNTVNAGFTGTVTDLQGNPVSGVAVTAGGVTVFTNASGMYRIANTNVNKERAVVSASKSGFWKQQSGLIVAANVESRVDFMLFPDNKGYTVNGAGGGVVNLPGGTTVSFPANAFVTASGTAYTGQVTLTVHEISTADNNFAKKIPGRDLYALNASGNKGVLTSFGMAGAKLYDTAGNELKLASGKTATVRFPIAPAQLSTAPATIALWHYNETKMCWVEEGSATRNGTYYEGSVSHFSWWNCDAFSASAQLTMNLTQCDSFPLYNVVVSLTFNNTTVYGMTDGNGSVYGYVPSNTLITATIYNLQNVVDTVMILGPYATGMMDTINLNRPGNCNTLEIHLVDCNNIPVNANLMVSNLGLPFYSGPTSNGVCYLAVTAPATYVIYASSGNKQALDSVVLTPSTPTPAVITLTLCDSVSTVAGNLNIDFFSPQSGFQSVYFSLIGARYSTSVGLPQMTLTYIDNISGDSASIVFHTPVYAPGMYSWNTTNTIVTGELLYAGLYMNFASNTGYTEYTSTPAVGGNFRGSFSGTVNNFIGPFPVLNLNATFDAVRLQ